MSPWDVYHVHSCEFELFPPELSSGFPRFSSGDVTAGCYNVHGHDHRWKTGL
jgi:hypothetical protein